MRPGLMARPRPFTSRGSTVVEFAFVALMFFALLFGIMEFGRVLFTWNSAAEATRYGARVAVVCAPNSRPLVLKRMQRILPAMSDSHLVLNYEPGGCTAENCQWVKVGLQNITITTMIPIPGGLQFTIPPFSTSLSRESMDSAADVCNLS